jgi:hypothetical protein
MALIQNLINSLSYSTSTASPAKPADPSKPTESTSFAYGFVYVGGLFDESKQLIRKVDLNAQYMSLMSSTAMDQEEKRKLTEVRLCKSFACIYAHLCRYACVCKYVYLCVCLHVCVNVCMCDFTLSWPPSPWKRKLNEVQPKILIYVTTSNILTPL